MNNLFPAHRDIHETYDLKGSTVGRMLPESKLEDNPNAVMKDLNWIKRERVLEVGVSFPLMSNVPVLPVRWWD